MPTVSPIDVRALNKAGVFDEDRFYRLLSEQCNYTSPEVVKSFYMGLVRHLTAELRKNGVVRLPELGDLALVKQKERFGWAGQFQGIIQGKYMLKFYIKGTWRKYFSKLEEKSGREGALDPREKVLGKSLE